MWSKKVNQELKARAAEVIPNGMYGHQSVALGADDAPQFFTSSKGARLTDVDGNEYVDFLCAYGPNLLGYDHPEILSAIRDQMECGDTMTGPSPLMVDLAETLTGMISHADWAMFCKNGSDATTMALMTARAFRGKRKVLVARGAYHGSSPWNTPRPAGVVAEDRAHLIYFDYNDLDSLRDAVKQAGNDLAGIFASPYRHDTFKDQTLPDRDYARGVRAICDERDAVLVVDEVRTGFRLSRDTVWSDLGVDPDLSCWGKVLGNGQPISALMGGNRIRKGAESIFSTGSFWFSAVPMAAALATMRIVRETDYLERIDAWAQDFRDALHRQAQDFGFGLKQTGPATMPMILFEDDPDFRLGYRWCNTALKHGAYLSPYHNMFICAAMGADDMAQSLAATGAAFEDLRKNRSDIEPSQKLAALRMLAD